MYFGFTQNDHLILGTEAQIIVNSAAENIVESENFNFLLLNVLFREQGIAQLFNKVRLLKHGCKNGVFNYSLEFFVH